MLDQTWKFFCSLKLTAALLGLLMAGSVAGMFIDQTLTFDQHLSIMEGHPLRARLFALFEMYDLFGSWWFMGLVLCLALNLIACTIERLPSIWRDTFARHIDAPIARIEELPLRAELVLDSAEQSNKVSRWLSARLRGRHTHKDLSAGKMICVERHRLTRLTVVLVHLSLLIIIFGHLGNSLLGVNGSIAVPEGETSSTLFVRGPAGLTKREELGFAIRCDDFRLETFVSGQPKDYESDLVVEDAGGHAIKNKTIRVNDPLEHAGYKFYQSSYQQLPGEARVRLQVGPRGQPLAEQVVGIGERMPLADGGALVPVEIIDNLSGFGEGLKLTRVAADGSTRSLMLLRRFPQMDAELRKGAEEIRYLGAEHRYVTVLSAGQAPLAPVVFVGFALLLFGSTAGMLMSRRIYWIVERPLPDGRVALLIAGTARRTKQAFAAEFATLVAAARGQAQAKPQPQGAHA